MNLRNLMLQIDAQIDASILSEDPDVEIANQFEAAFADEQKPKRGRPQKEHQQCETVLATLDFETDPFRTGRVPKPFVWDFYDGKTHTTYWNKFDESLCVPKLVEFLHSLTKSHLIYAHNGGKFDFLLLRKYLAEQDDKNLFVINGRIVSIKFGRHELRDSFAALPVPQKKMGKGAKLDIDYDKFEPDVRLKYYDEIIHYLKHDTELLYEYVSKYVQEFGNVKTMASAAIKELKRFYTYAKCNESVDKFFRDYYYGGRVQCFKSGVHYAPVKVYDVNSMYPFVMAHNLHPIGDSCYSTSYITQDTFFIDVEGKNDNAFPMRTPNGLSFSTEKGRYKVTIHEYNVALETGRFQPTKIHACYNCAEKTSFTEFVEYFHRARLQARKESDSARDLFYKLVLNSSYGKFAQNPRLFENYRFLCYSDPLPENICQCSDTPCSCGGWRVKQDNEEERIMLISQKADAKPSSYHNILTAASITGAARAMLLYGIHHATNVYYCDTDSLICESLSGVQIDADELGAWKLEAIGDKLAIAGKKNYAIWRRVTDKFVPVKKASKGTTLSYSELERVARGETIEWTNDAPTFRLTAAPMWITRKIQRTA